MNKLSIIIPVYNEENTIETLLDRVAKAKISIKKEIIVVNDGSRDNSEKLIKSYISKNKKSDIKYFKKENGGKGSAVREGINNSTGSIIIIQDADLEYNPDEYQKLIQPIIDGKVKVVYGSRILNKSNKRYSHISFFLGGLIVTFVTNVLFLSRLTDEPTCYKVFSSDVIKKIKIKHGNFDWEPEVTAKILKKGIKIKEIPITYNPRAKSEGKKINWRDGLSAIRTLFYYRFFNE